MFGDREHDSYTKSSPSYGISKDMLEVIFIGVGLLVANIFVMIGLANTIFSDYFSLAFQIPIVGVLIFGILLTVGRHLALESLENDNLFLAGFGVIILFLTYGSFGGGILSFYSEQIWIESLIVTLIIVVIITILATAYVITKDRNLSYLVKYSTGAFMIGIVITLLGSFVNGLLLLAFPFFLIGFLIDLVYELWLATTKDRTTLQNGIAVYVAVTGIFVHILQLVLRFMSKR